jgi:hypothetical protein
MVVATFSFSHAHFDLPAVSTVSHLQASQMRGGIPNWCIETKFDCPDPNGLPAACTLNPATQLCRQCENNVATRSYCIATDQQPFDCSQTSTGNTCGAKKKGTPPSLDCTVSPACEQKDGTCGVALFTTTGVPCP